MWDLTKLNFTTWKYQDGTSYESVLNREGNFVSENANGHYIFRLDGNYAEG